MAKKIVVVTGGAGFVGSHLCQHLIREGFRIICLDNLITGDVRNIRHLNNEINFNFLRHDIARPIDIKGKVDWVMHFASPASPIDYLKFPVQTLEVGSSGTRNALELARRKRSRFMLASTSEVYGDPLVHPQPEGYWGNVNPVGPRSCYDEAKRFAEALTMAYHRVYKIDTRIVRIFNTYGERMKINDGRVVPNFIYQALNSLPLTVYGKGKQTRSFCYISDLIEGIVRLMYAQINTPLNLGNPREFTILELAEIILKLLETKSKIVFRPLPQDDPRQRRPNITQAKKILKWKPKVGIAEGLKKTIEWFKRETPPGIGDVSQSSLSRAGNVPI